MNVLGISCYYHDAAAALIVDGHVVAAAAEERFTRKKHDSEFPQNAIDFCLEWAHLKASDLDGVAFYEKPIIKFDRVLHQHLHTFPQSRNVFVQSIDSWFYQKLRIREMLKKYIGYTGKVFFFPHHLSHAASSYLTSPFDRAAIVTLDGVGEWATTAYGVGQGLTIRMDREIRFPHSLGLFYSTMTAYLGFAVNNDEYKVMGLAAYGDPERFAKQMDELITVFDDGSFALSMEYFDFAWADHMPSPLMKDLLGFSPRVAESQVDSNYKDLAAAVQWKLEQVVFHLLRAVYKQYETPNLCLAGGVALNSVMNGKICAQTPFRRVFIPPDPSDAGGAIGAALLAEEKRSVHKHKRTSMSPSLGPAYADDQIETALDMARLRYRKLTHAELPSVVSTLLSKKKIVGWFQGRMEWGPRALGNRSILASARHAKMKDIINRKVKHREMFRPFAPVVLDRYVKKYFQTDDWLSPSSKYMLLVYPFKNIGVQDVPATVHVDGTGRLQVISREDNPRYYDVVDAYRQKTGVPIIINTSFNVAGEPIVCTPNDAIACFLSTAIDYLVIGTYLVQK
jgi:carbamoyltransferase